MVLNSGAPRVDHRQQGKTDPVACIRYTRHRAQLLILRERADIDVNAYRVCASSQAIFHIPDQILERWVCGVLGRGADMDNDGKLCVDRLRKQSQTTLMDDDRVGAVLGKDAYQPIVP